MRVPEVCFRLHSPETLLRLGLNLRASSPEHVSPTRAAVDTNTAQWRHLGAATHLTLFNHSIPQQRACATRCSRHAVLRFGDQATRQRSDEAQLLHSFLPKPSTGSARSLEPQVNPWIPSFPTSQGEHWLVDDIFLSPPLHYPALLQRKGHPRSSATLFS